MTLEEKIGQMVQWTRALTDRSDVQSIFLAGPDGGSSDPAGGIPRSRGSSMGKLFNNMPLQTRLKIPLLTALMPCMAITIRRGDGVPAPHRHGATA